jgi:hypothetical protein
LPTVDLYYSAALFGHFTLIVYDRVELIVYRVHFVDRDADAARGGRLAWATHKIAQLTGFASGRALVDWVASPQAFEDRVAYAALGRTMIRRWTISVNAMDAMLNWANEIVSDQDNGHFGSYGYVIYSNNVDNCTSWALKCLAQGGIVITLPTLKSWIPIPSLVHGNI